MDFFGFFGTSKDGPEYHVVEVSEDAAIEAEVEGTEPVLRKDIIGSVYGRRRWTELFIAFFAGALSTSLMHSFSANQQSYNVSHYHHASTDDSRPPYSDPDFEVSAGVDIDGEDDAYDFEEILDGGFPEDLDGSEKSVDLAVSPEPNEVPVQKDGDEKDTPMEVDHLQETGGGEDGSDGQDGEDGDQLDGSEQEPQPSSPESPSIFEVEPDVPLAEREKFQRHVYDSNWLQSPKPTPSGWWPDAEWIMECVSRPRDLHPFDTLTEFENYRLGDCVKLCAGCPKEGYLASLTHDASIAGQYYDAACDPEGPQYHMKRGNETLLFEILKNIAEFSDFDVPDPEAIVIHLRLGDKMERSKSDPATMLQFGADPGGKAFKGMHAIKSLYEFLTDIVISEAPKVIIRGGSQWPLDYKKSKTYAYCLQEAVEKAGFDVEINLEEGNPDKDFFYMVNARKLIPSVGGFSRFIAHIVLETGGIVYGRVFR